MKTNEFILDILTHMDHSLTGAVDGLTPDELKWQPNLEANSIGFTLWHQTRTEDSFVRGIIQNKPQLWIEEKWHEKMGLPADPQDSGWGYTPEQLAAFRTPKLDDLTGYGKSCRAETIAYLEKATEKEMDRVIETGIFGEMPVGRIFSLLVCEITLHIGHITYLRGLQRGINK